MSKKHFWLNLIFLIGMGFAVFIFEFFCFNGDFLRAQKNNIAFAQSCKPVDIILVIDRSGSMNNLIPDETITKMQAAKETLNGPFCVGVLECVNSDGCCPIACNKDNDNDCTGFIDLLKSEDHIGIVSFSTGASLDQTLTDNKAVAKGAVNSLSPGGGTETHIGIGAARIEFDSIRARADSPHAMIILTDGRPGSVPLAQSQAGIAKNAGIRVIVIGYDIDSTSNPEGTRIILRDDVASTPSDYYEASTTENLGNIYTSLAAQLCDSYPPEISSVSRIPSGTVFSSDGISITSTATDNTDGNDWGLFIHRIKWTDDNWVSTNTCESSTLNYGDKVDTFSCDIGPFSEGTEIKYRAFAKDLASYEVYSAEESFTVAEADILNTYLIVDQTNTIEIEIDDPQGKAHFDKYYVEIESPSSGVIKVSKTEMVCGYSGSIYECSYTLCPTCAYKVDDSWASKAKIIIYPWSDPLAGGLGFHNPAAEKEVDVIFDTTLPTVVIVACNISKNDVVGDACDSYGGDIISNGGFVLNTDSITLVSIAGDTSGIQNQKIFYWVNGSIFIEEWIISGGASTTKTTTIGSYSAGTLIQYKTEATDVWNNTAYDPAGALKYSFNVYSAECYNTDGTSKADLTSCAGGSGKCCAGICDASFSCSLDDECWEEICSGASWTCAAQNEGADCCDGANCDGCFAYGAGCEERDYSCLAGNCASQISDRNNDICSGQNYLNYQCVSNSCNLIETIDCSLANNWNGVDTICNCNCDDYDVEEKISNGNCEDGKDNDCDSNIVGNDCGGGSCIDCEEPACDDEMPATTITADDSGGFPIDNGEDVLDADTNRVSLNVISSELTALPCVTSPNILYEVKVLYNINDGPWNLIFTCTDAGGDGQCDEDVSKDIEDFNVEIPVDGFSAGTKVGYKAKAVDTAPSPNTGCDEGFFNVISVECQGIDDVSITCVGGTGRCCDQVCDTSFDCSLDDECLEAVCSGIYWTCQSNNEGNNCSPGAWAKRKPIEIDNTLNSSKLEDYQVKIEIPYDDDMQIDFDDLRFTDENGASLSYWTEKIGGILRLRYKGNSGHPSNHQELIDDYEFSTIYEETLETEIDSPRSVADYFNWLYTSHMYVEKEGYWQFAIDGDDAVEVEIDGSVVASWYGGHTFCSCYSYDGQAYLTKGWHEIIVRHEEDGGNDGVVLYFKAPGDTNWKIFSIDNLERKAYLFAHIPSEATLKTKDFIENGFSEKKQYATVWVKTPEIPASSKENIYMYYGNPEASSASSGDLTFEFFDDFEGTAIDNSKWVEIDNGSYLSQNDKLIATGGSSGWTSNGLYSVTNFNRQDSLIAQWDYKPTGGSYFMFGWKDATTGWSYANLVYGYYDTANRVWVYEDGSSRGQKLGSWTHGRIYKIKMPLKIDRGALYQRSLDTGQTWETLYNSSYSAESPLKIGLINYNGAFEINNLFVRKYASLEPSAIIGVEENSIFNETGECFSYGTGCQQKEAPDCQSGYCLSSITDQFIDHCEDINWMDYECNGGNCELISSNPDPRCDVEAPTVSIEAKDNTDVPIPGGTLIPDGNEINPSLTDKITLTSIAIDNYILQSHQVQYRVNSGAWITLFVCDDSDSNGFCDDDNQNSIPFEAGENSTISITFLSGSALDELKIGPFVHNDLVEYRSIATDIAQPDPNTTCEPETDGYSFLVREPNTQPTVTPLVSVVYPNGEEYWRSSGSNCWKALQTKVAWSYSDSDGDAQDAYQVEVYDDADYSNLILDSCDPPTLTCAPGHSSKDYIVSNVLDWNTDYWWRVRVFDGKDWSDFENGGSFKTPLHLYPTVDFTLVPNFLEIAGLDAPVNVEFTQASECYTTDNPDTAVDCGTEGTKIIRIAWDFYRETATEPNLPNVLGELLDVDINNAGGIDPSAAYNNTFFINMPYPVYLQITDQDGYTCSIIKDITPGGMKYPWWREILPK